LSLGRDVTLERRIAIKIRRPQLVTATTAERFLRQARTLARFSHPNIVPIHHAGDSDGILYYVMDFIEGTTLSDRLSGGPLPPDVVPRLATDLLEALETTHGLGVIHRDIKPANIFLVGGRAVLVDFGIARSVSEADTGLTVPGQRIGTLAYMAPEQLTTDAV